MKARRLFGGHLVLDAVEPVQEVTGCCCCTVVANSGIVIDAVVVVVVVVVGYRSLCYCGRQGLEKTTNWRMS